MSAGAWSMALTTVIVAGSLAVLIGATVRGVRAERRRGRSVWREFGLGMILMALFLSTWMAHAVAQWQVFTDERRARGQAVAAGDFVATLAQTTLQNWQSEFLQLFAFVVLSALYIHKGSASSKDGSDKLEASLRRIEERLGTLPDTAPHAPAQQWKLPDTPLEAADR